MKGLQPKKKYGSTYQQYSHKGRPHKERREIKKKKRTREDQRKREEKKKKRIREEQRKREEKFFQ